MELPKTTRFPDWSSVGKYFNYNGIAGVKKDTGKGNLIYLSFSGTDLEELNELKEFLKYGNILARKDAKHSFVFKTRDRKQILDFFLNVYPHAPLRQPILDFLIGSYFWSPGNLNSDFNHSELNRLTERWKLLVRQEELLKLKSKIEKEPEESEEMEGGEQ